MSSTSSLVKEFIAVTGSDEVTARHMLEACSNNLESAVTNFLDGGFHKNGKDKQDLPKDSVRAPIPQMQGVLVDDYTTSSKWTRRARPRSVFDGYHGFKADNEKSEVSGDTKKLKRLEDLFRPPMGIMHKGTFQSARDEGTSNNKWLMVNIQNIQEFSCQALNRDVWSNKKVKALIKENFIFWQEYSDSFEGERFMTFYSVTEWPHVSIVDPRTGGRLTTLTDITVDSFIRSVNMFLDGHGFLDPCNPNNNSKNDILNFSEDSQIAAAIAMSLQDTKTSHYDIIDDDESDLESVHSFNDEDESTPTSKTEDLLKNSNSDNSNAENRTLPPSQNGHDTTTSSHVRGIVKTPPKKTFTKIFPKKRKYDATTSPFKASPSPKHCKHTSDSQFSTHNFSNIESTESVCNGNSLKGISLSSKNKCRLMLKYPDGTREKITMNATDTIKDLTYLLSKKNYSTEQYELVTNFPRKHISSLPVITTLEEAGLCPQETIFIQEHL